MADYMNNAEQKEDSQLHENETEKNPVYAEVPVEKSFSKQSLDRNSNKSTTYEEDMNDVVIEREPPHDYRNTPMPVSLPAGPPSRNEPHSSALAKTNDGKGAISLHNRDPNNLHEAVIVNFEDIIAEPEGTHSFNTIWETSYTVYFYTKFWLYRVLSLVFGVPFALLWGIYFGIFAFIGIWLIVPSLKAISIPLRYVGKLYSVIIHTFVDPIFESLGLVFSRIKIKMAMKD